MCSRTQAKNFQGGKQKEERKEGRKEGGREGGREGGKGTEVEISMGSEGVSG